MRKRGIPPSSVSQADRVWRSGVALAWPLVAALVACASVALPAGAQESGGIRGEVRSEGSGVPLPGATVEVVSAGWTGRVASDEAGRYRVVQVPAGRSLLRVRHLGHEPLEMEVFVPAGRELELAIALPIRPLSLAPITVEGGRGATVGDSASAPAAELGLMEAHALGATPGLAELGLGEAVRGIPGNEPADPGSILYVRGAGADLKLVYLDGAPVYAPFPLGGLIEPFTPGLLTDANIYLGGAPARYDGGLSYVMDLRTRSGRTDGVHTSGSLDLLSARVLAEGGIHDRVSVIASARGIHSFGSENLLGEGLPYGYREGFLRTDLSLGRTGLLSITGFRNAESVSMGEPSIQDNEIAWGNAAGSVRLRGDVAGTGAELSFSVGDYAARLPLTGGAPLVADGSARRMRVAADFARRTGLGQIRYGASLDRQAYHASAWTIPANRQAAEVDASGQVAGVYGEVSARPDTRVLLRGGLRMDHYSVGDRIAFAPRLSATWLITEHAALTLAAGRYHQYLRPADEVLLIEASPLAVAGRPAALAVGGASHFSASLDQDLGDGVRLGVEGFYKHFSDIPGSLALDANASGVDLWVRRGVGQWNGWLGYSLAWVWTAGRSGVDSEFRGRHLLNAGLGAPVAERTRLDLRFAYGAGLPYSGIVLGERHGGFMPSSGRVTNYAATHQDLTTATRGGTETAPLLSTPDKPFLRFDLSLSQQWEPRRGDTVYRITPYVRVLNSLGRRDALFYYFDGAPDGSPRAIGALPVIPVVGLEWNF